MHRWWLSMVAYQQVTDDLVISPLCLRQTEATPGGWRGEALTASRSARSSYSECVGLRSTPIYRIETRRLFPLAAAFRHLVLGMRWCEIDSYLTGPRLDACSRWPPLSDTSYSECVGVRSTPILQDRDSTPVPAGRRFPTPFRWGTCWPEQAVLRFTVTIAVFNSMVY